MKDPARPEPKKHNFPINNFESLRNSELEVIDESKDSAKSRGGDNIEKSTLETVHEKQISIDAFAISKSCTNPFHSP